MTTHGKQFVCSMCGEKLPDREFRNKHNRREKACQRCRRNAKARFRYKQKVKEMDKRVANAAKRDMTELLQDSNAYKLIREVRRIAAQDKHFERKYRQRIENGEGTAKTHDALELRQKRIEFYKMVESLIMENERRGVFYPLSYYLTNTKLLASAGFPTRIRRGDPDLLLEASNSDTREEGQERDSQNPKTT